MTALAHDLLVEVLAAGGELVVAGHDRLKVRAPAPLPDELLDRLRAHKPELLAALKGGVETAPGDSSDAAGATPCRDTSGTAGARREAPQLAWDTSDWRAFYDERAGIREYDGRRARPDAERFAWSEIQCEWHRLHGVRTPEWQCAGCGKPISGSPDSVLPDGARAHDDLTCIAAYGRRWRTAATAALVKLGLPKPPTVPEDEPCTSSGWGSA